MSKCNDKWTSKDKALHFGVCLVLAAINPFIAILAAMGKELYDMQQPNNHFCWKDVVADVAGIAVGSAVHGLLFCSVLFCSVLFCSVLFCSVLFCSVLLNP